MVTGNRNRFGLISTTFCPFFALQWNSATRHLHSPSDRIQNRLQSASCELLSRASPSLDYGPTVFLIMAFLRPSSSLPFLPSPRASEMLRRTSCWLELKPMVTRGEHTRWPTKFEVKRNTSRRRRRIRIGHFDATSCKSLNSILALERKLGPNIAP